MIMVKTSMRWLLLAGVSLAVSGCLGAGGGGTGGGLTGAAAPASGGALGNLFQFGTTAPAPVAEIEEEPVPCPPVSIAPGGAALRLQSGQSNETVRAQVSIIDVARECTNRPDRGVSMRVGTEGRVLIGPAGGSATQSATLRIEVRKGEQLITSRSVRVGAAVPAGQAQASWVNVEQGIEVPGSAFAGGGDIDVFVTLNPSTTRNDRQQRRRGG